MALSIDEFTWQDSNVTESWEEAARTAEKRLGGRLWTRIEFLLVLENLIKQRGSPIAGMFATIASPAPMGAVSVGRKLDSDPDATETYELGTAGIYSVRVEFWYNSGADGDHDVGRQSVKRLLEAWWRADGRSDKSRLLSGQMSNTQRALEQSIIEWSTEGAIVLCSGDIDYFKIINDEINHQHGDVVIGRLSAALADRSPEDSLVVHRSGDEFMVIYPSGRPGAVIADAMRIRSEVEDVIRDGLPSLSKTPGFSMGIAVCEDSVTFSQLEVLAERALIPGGQKRRGKVNAPSTTIEVIPASINPIDLQIVVGINLLDVEEPFNVPWLDAASVVASRVCEVSTNAASLRDSLRAALENFQDDDGSISVNVVIAVAHGVMRSLLQGKCPEDIRTLALRFASDGVAVIEPESNIVLSGDGDLTGYREIVVTSSDPSNSDIDSRRSVLVSVGDFETELPDSLFAAVVKVDDRPTLGGGLPDLWEAAIAQVVVSVIHHSNVSRLFIGGNLEMGLQTVTRLNGAEKWIEYPESELLALKLGLPPSRIVQTGQALGGHVVATSDVSLMVSTMLDDLISSSDLIRPKSREPEPEPRRLRRSIAQEGIEPDFEFGCRVATASEAFPVALDIVRQKDAELLSDQSRRVFRELTDFRIQLSQPLTSPIPRFYLADRESLDAYFTTVFMKGDGLFRSRLEINNQLESVIAHVTKVIGDGQTTRRAMLVVPHVPIDEETVDPLGLVSIHIVPHLVNRSVRLDFSFSWRTVEAVKGLPYSLYGSIKFAEHLSQVISSNLAVSGKRVSMGSLSYVAHNLHMFVDEYADQIARLIVNDDSL